MAWNDAKRAEFEETVPFDLISVREFPQIILNLFNRPRRQNVENPAIQRVCDGMTDRIRELRIVY